MSQDGQSAYQSGEYRRAADLFEAAARAHNDRGQTLLAAEAANNQSVALLQAGQPEAALAALAGTQAVFEAAGDLRRQALAIGNRAAALEGMGRLEEAEDAYRRSARLLKQIGEGDLYANVMQSISALQLRSGRQLEALSTMQAGVEEIERPTLRQRMLRKLLQIPYKMFNRS